MSSSLSRLPFALRGIFIAALIACSARGDLLKDTTKVIAEEGEGPNTSLRGASKEDMSSPMARTQPVYPLNDPLKAAQLAFFQQATGIKDSSELESHICSIQKEAYDIFPYPCIWNFNFLGGKAVNHPFYPLVSQTAREQSNRQQIFVELGAFLGTDLRQVVHDGWKREDVLGVDIVTDWPKLGCRLFNEAENSTPYFVGNILKEEVFDPSDPNLIAPGHSKINLRGLKDLNPLKRRARFVMANCLFSLFGEDAQRQLARCCAALLSEERGSAIFGLQRGAEFKAYHNFRGKTTGIKFFCHSPESWKELWNSMFNPGEVQVKACLEVLGGQNRNQFVQGDGDELFLKWSVERT